MDPRLQASLWSEIANFGALASFAKATISSSTVGEGGHVRLRLVVDTEHAREGIARVEGFLVVGHG